MNKYLKISLISIVVIGVLSTTYLVFWVLSFRGDSGQENRNRTEQQNIAKGIVNDVTGINPIQTQGIIVPHTTEEIQNAVRTHAKVSIGGGRYSMGGQTASQKAVQIDMREFNKIISISTSTKEITVQAGIRWRAIQDAIDPHGLSIKIMQTYSNFTVGGSLSVNVHGRYIGLGPLIMSVKHFQLVLADGSVVEVYPDTRPELFYSVIGGMGGIGVITQVTLALEDNVNVVRQRVKMPADEYKQYFFDNIRSNPDVVFHNGDMYPLDFDSVSAVSWVKTDKEPNTESRLIPRAQDYWIERIAWVVMSEWPFGKAIREYILEPYLYSSEAVHTRNYEASYDVAELEPYDREKATYVLQEYFIPVEKFDVFYPKMRDVFVNNDVNILNVSVRHAKQDPGALLAWAKEEVFAFVVYYKQGTDDKAKDEVARWTREMIDLAISVGGSYYLPYQPHATETQFHRAYPRAVEFFEIKKKYDPTNKFTSTLWDIYYDPEKIFHTQTLHAAEMLASTTKDYVRFGDNMFLSLPEWYIVYSAGEYANVLRDSLPSHFDYLQSISDYWSQHKTVKGLIRGTESQNKNYFLVLQVIGWSFTFENSVKWVYENSIGRLSEWIAGGVQVEEDVFAAKVAREYEKFIYDYPWYDFPYRTYYIELGTLEDTKDDYSFGETLRRWERRFFLTIELNGKRFYSWVIRKATQAKFGVQDDVIYTVLKEDGKYELLSAPHYHPFTKALVARLEKAERASSVLEVVEIAGNTEITFVYLDKEGAQLVPYTTEVTRDREVQAIENGVEVAKDRITVLVKTSDIDDVYKMLIDKGTKIEHFYDY